jgi:hypothetical protein
MSRVRPGDSAWPSEASWERLSREVGGRLAKVQSPLAACLEAPSSPSCAHVFKELKNPYFLGDEVGLTQSLGWIDAWTSRPSAYALVARTTDDVVAAVNFAAREQFAARREGWWRQLSGHLQCRGFFADLDTKDECLHLARRVHRCRVRRTTQAGTGRHGRSWCDLEAGL